MASPIYDDWRARIPNCKGVADGLLRVFWERANLAGNLVLIR
jgi:hypothetical protein